MTRPPTSDNKAGDFAAESERPRTMLAGELWDFLRATKRWWLTPVIASLLIVAALVAVGSTAAGSFLYTLF